MNDHVTPEDRRTTTAELSWMLWTAIGIGGIWIAVLLISLLAPDMVTGSEQQHLPVAAFATWLPANRASNRRATGPREYQPSDGHPVTGQSPLKPARNESTAVLGRFWVERRAAR
jgi:hypothetical protein